MAQTLEWSVNMRLDDNTPRTARSIALGSATDALDDVDMAANPATLMNVAKTMVLTQGAYNSASARRDVLRDNFPASEQIRVDASSLSYIAAAKPVGAAVIGVYYAAMPRQAGPDPIVRTFETAPYHREPCQYPCVTFSPIRPEPFERVEHRYGVALAWKLGGFDVGAGAEMQRIAEHVEYVLVEISDITASTSAVRPQRILLRAESREVVPNLGVRWRVTPRLAMAASYTGAGTLATTAGVCSTPDLDSPVCTSSLEDLGPGAEPMPDTLRAGVSFAATDRLRLVAESVRRGWTTQPMTDPATGQKAFADTIDVRAGAEYKLGSIALRAGWWRDPGQLRQKVPYWTLAQVITHRTLGAGIDLGRTRLDVAYDDANLPNYRRAAIGLTYGF